MEDSNTEKSPVSHKKTKGYYISRIIFVIALAVFIAAAVNIVRTLLNYRSADNSYSDLRDEFITEAEEADDYSWLLAMHEQYPDIVGWITIDGTNIDYPVMHRDGSDGDEYYLHTDYTDTYSVNGSIFIETLNSADMNDAYTVIYGHNMKSGAMFHDITGYSDEDYYAEHPDITMLIPISDDDGTGVEVRTYSIFSYHIIESDDILYSVGYELGTDTYSDLIDRMYSGRYYDTGVDAGSDAETITLSTCTSANSSSRAVVHAVLTNEETWTN